MPTRRSWRSVPQDLPQGGEPAFVEGVPVEVNANPPISAATVPGSFELPVAAKVLAGRGYGAIVALGVVIRGGTPHFEYVSQGVTQGLVQVSAGAGIPVGFGVLTCDNEDQAFDRAGLEGSREDKGHEAVTAAVATALALQWPNGPQS
ncbi:6,7-dimethyl-8-ribityllumazine synthase [Streptomyces sp. NPDC005141]